MGVVYTLVIVDEAPPPAPMSYCHTGSVSEGVWTTKGLEVIVRVWPMEGLEDWRTQAGGLKDFRTGGLEDKRTGELEDLRT